VTPEAQGFLLQEGTDLKYGARHLKRAIERHLVSPLANLLATEQVKLGDVLTVDWDDSQQHLLFLREAEGALLPKPAPKLDLAAPVAPPTDSRAVAVRHAAAGPGAAEASNR
jgi:hypothetical protein